MTLLSLAHMIGLSMIAGPVAIAIAAFARCYGWLEAAKLTGTIFGLIAWGGLAGWLLS